MLCFPIVFVKVDVTIHINSHLFFNLEIVNQGSLVLSTISFNFIVIKLRYIGNLVLIGCMIKCKFTYYLFIVKQ